MKNQVSKKIVSGGMAVVLSATMFAGVLTTPSISNQENSYIVQTLEASAASYSTGTYKVNCPSGVNVRNSASTSGSKLGASSNGTQFTVTKISGSWGYTSSIKCTNGTKSGWVCLDNCKFIASSSTNTTSSTNYQAIITATSGLNVRSSYSTSSSKVTAIPYNTTVTVTEVSSNNWGKVTYNGKTGWISLDYTKKVTSTPTSSSAVSLKVPSFKQTDSRWKNTYIGNKTIGSVGCTLTSVAMLYSYKTGTTVYPNTMKSKLSFSNNSVYWSSVSNLGFNWTIYSGKTISQDIMKTIYSKLQSGKPVMIGCSNSNGNEHWVVITGYSGSTSNFTASGFTINDPAYNRTNLQQHLNYVNKIQRIVY